MTVNVENLVLEHLSHIRGKVDQIADDTSDLTFIITVSVYGGIWTAECEALGLVTEAESYNELIERTWAITPELGELNLIGIDVDAIRLVFAHEQYNHQIAS